MPRALSVYLPGWPIWLARRKHKSTPPDPPAASGRPDATAWLLWTSQRGVRQVVCGCERAAAAGVRPAMTLAHARCLLAGTTVRERPATPREDAAALRRLARWMLRFAPAVAPDDPDGLMLDIAGCERLFGGRREHVRRMAAALRRWGLRPRMAVAPTFACAWAVARFGGSGGGRHDRPGEDIAWVADDAIRAALAPLPVRALRIDEKALDALANVGIERIGHLLDVPRDELAARFGPALLYRLDQATGAAGETIRSVQPARRLETSRAFEGPVRRIEIIEATARELLAKLIARLRAADRGLLEWSVVLRRVDLGPETLFMRLTCPSRDPAHLWTLLRPRLERLHLGFGVEEVILRATRTGRLPDGQAAFLREAAESSARQPAALGELIDRLMDRLGRQAVTHVRPAETYVPEQAFVHAGVDDVASVPATRARSAAPAIQSAHRPSRLFETPEPIRVISLVPDGPPVWLDWRGLSGEVVAGIGPERIALPWWTGSPAAGRDYYEVEDEHGRWLWVYRDAGSGRWFVHGQWM